MQTIKLKKLHPMAILPIYQTPGSNAVDIHACIDTSFDIYPGETILVSTGFSMELPKGKAALLIPRSGIGHKNGIVLGNLIGLIDSDYRGQVFVSLWNRNDWGNPSYPPAAKTFRVSPNDRIAQMMIIDIPQYNFQWANEINETKRGESGFGSTNM